MVDITRGEETQFSRFSFRQAVIMMYDPKAILTNLQKVVYQHDQINKLI